MFKALLKKQLLETGAFLLQDKEGKRRSVQGILGFSLLLLIGLASMCFLFFGMGTVLCLPLAQQGMSWVYFAFMGALATAFGVIGSVFTAKTKLYEAKDNDLLLSMPIPSWMILFSRLTGLYLFTLLFVGVVFLPALVAYLVWVEFSVTVLLCSILVLVIMPFFALAICCLLGWVFALIAAKLPGKNVLTVIFTVVFMVVYFMGYSKIDIFLDYVINNGEGVGKAMQTWLYPFWQMGLACTGKLLPMLVYAAIFLGLFALVYLLMDRTYLRLATANKGGKRAKYTGKGYKQTSWFGALFKKELLRFTKNPMVAMNCLLGTIFMLVFPFVALFAGEFRQAIAAVNEDEIFAMILALLLCAVMSMNMISAASVSLEGESIWVVRSLPVQTEKVLLAKAGFHFLMTAIPSAFASIFFCILFRIGIGYSVAVLAFALVFSALGAVLGLAINLKLPNLNWTNELHPVKQSLSTVLSMFAEWAVLGLLVGGYFLFGKYLFSGGYFLVCILLSMAVIGLLTAWLGTRGKQIFEEL